MAPQEQPAEPSPELGTPSESEPQPMSEMARLTGVFSSPSAAFRDIARRPRWWIPVILIAVVATAFMIAFGERVGFESAARRMLESSAQGGQMNRAQLDQSVRFLAGILKYVQYGSVISTLIYVFLMSVVFKFLFDGMMGAGIGLNRMMGVVAYAQLPTVISTLLAMLVMNLKSPDDFDLQNPLAFNVGAFLGADSAAWLQSLGASLDLFSFWIIFLLATGISAASRKVAFGKALAGVVFPWALYVALKVGASAIRG
jgi:hypothetical protein